MESQEILRTDTPACSILCPTVHAHNIPALFPPVKGSAATIITAINTCKTANIMNHECAKFIEI
jgi:hypothetical protein